jgi:hypothetical protein
MSNPEQVIVGMDRNVPVIQGSCPKCNIGNRSLILIDFVPNYTKSEDGIIYMKCMGCFTIYQTKVKFVAE